jgi:putative tryptophan/tyrosine transport system substrate-binding protein
VRQRVFIALAGCAATAWPLGVRAQQPALPLVGFLSGRSLASDANLVAAFKEGLNENGYVEGRDVTIEYHWADGQFDRLPELAADLVRRQVSVIFAGGMDVKIRAVRDGRCCSRQNSSWSSTSRLRRHSASRFRRICSRSPTK